DALHHPLGDDEARDAVGLLHPEPGLDLLPLHRTQLLLDAQTLRSQFVALGREPLELGLGGDEPLAVRGDPAQQPPLLAVRRSGPDAVTGSPLRRATLEGAGDSSSSAESRAFSTRSRRRLATPPMPRGRPSL